MKTIKKVERSQGLVEYALIIVLIAIVVIVAIEFLNIDPDGIVGSFFSETEVVELPTYSVVEDDNVVVVESTPTEFFSTPTLLPTQTEVVPTNTVIPTPVPTEVVPMPSAEEVEVHPWMASTLDWLVSEAQEVCPSAEWFITASSINASPIVAGTFAGGDPAYLFLFLCGNSSGVGNRYLVIFENTVILAPENFLLEHKSHWGIYVTQTLDITLRGNNPNEWITEYSCRFLPEKDPPVWIFSMSQEVFDIISEETGYVGNWMFSEECP